MGLIPGAAASGPFSAIGTYTGTGAAQNVNVLTACGISWHPRQLKIYATTTYNRLALVEVNSGTTGLIGFNTTTVVNDFPTSTFDGTTLALTAASDWNVSAIPYTILAW